ncbi:hypothetical protein AVEN_200871-1 [Araneus ventricosus]|uniref:Uncharacterized protein n=1 Tax=Araneus ventricosus TaxID=182803 RepID=A0A4Y2TM23_ARAVE|nr:hypothetical protein AVEN_200871-1 [Araneus ventricosus]
MFLAMFITNVGEDRLKCWRRCFDEDDNVAVDVGGGGSADVSGIGDVVVELRSNSPKGRRFQERNGCDVQYFKCL